MNVLVLTLSFGSGHVRAAQAIADEISYQDGEAKVLVVDALAEAHLLFRACYEWPYWFMLRYAPWLWSRLNSARHEQMHESTAPGWLFRFGCAKVFQTIKDFEPDLIVAVEVAACEISALATQMGITRAPILSVITDYEAEPIWIKPEVSAFTVADESGRGELIEWGASVDKIFITGIPIDASFAVIHNPKLTRRRYGIDDDLPMVLLMGGGMGPTRIDRVARELARANFHLHLIAITGHDRRVRRKLQALQVEPPSSLRILGWTEDVPALMQAADLLVTKPGGLTTLEAAVSSLPVVLFDPIPGAEFINAERMIGAGAAAMTSGARETANAVLSLVKDRATLKSMAEGARVFARPNARADIAALAIELGRSKRVGEMSKDLRARRIA